jgi:hypothetical protein
LPRSRRTLRHIRIPLQRIHPPIRPLPPIPIREVITNTRSDAMISIQGAVMVIVYIIVAGLIFGLLWWLIGYCGLPEPFNKLARVILAILAVLVVIGILLSMLGGVPIFRP